MKIEAFLPRTIATAALVLSASLATLATPAFAQTRPAHPQVPLSNIVPESAAVTLQAKITAIDPASRNITLANKSGTQVTVTAGPAVRLELLKVGDVVNAKYYRSVAFVVTGPTGGSGTPVSHSGEAEMLAQNATGPGGIGISVTKISGLVVGIDLAAHSVDLVDPTGGGIHTVTVTNPARIAALSKLKVGDTVTAVVSQAVAVEVTPAPKSWF